MKQIIALGGGGFSKEPENPLLDNYILKQSSSAKPKVCFIPTASGDSEGYIQRFYQAFEQLNCTASHLSLYKPPTLDIEDYIMDKDILYVGGGNTRNLVTLWKEWKLDQYIRSAYDSEIVLAGLSAGSICWFEEGVTGSLGVELSSLRALGFLQGSFCPHYDDESERRPSFHKLLESNQIGSGYAAADGVAFHYRDEEMYQVVSSRPNALAYRVELVNHEAVDIPIKPIYLGETA
ncbi:peptidase E [Paenibacillus albiflavus]|uniref:Peptidase E n=1 Tax=Paenibacillus albiflavus TaxID=2545760 RepID=A0A4R4DYF6_9BACL|nr:peptidase E [Paenibacillus albiflavus]TCZ68316.1 peptidase E [Paenibacillus albiflavus]